MIKRTSINPNFCLVVYEDYIGYFRNWSLSKFSNGNRKLTALKELKNKNKVRMYKSG